MNTAMGPPSRNPTAGPSPSTSEMSTKVTGMGPPPPRSPIHAKPETETETETQPEPDSLPSQQESQPISTQTDSVQSAEDSDSSCNSKNGTVIGVEEKQEQRNNNTAVPYTIPEWSGAPCHNFFIEVLKDGSIIDQLDMLVFSSYPLVLFLISLLILDFVDVSLYSLESRI